MKKTSNLSDWKTFMIQQDACTSYSNHHGLRTRIEKIYIMRIQYNTTFMKKFSTKNNWYSQKKESMFQNYAIRKASSKQKSADQD